MPRSPVPPITGTPPADLSARAVARELSCSLQTVRNLAHSGKLPGYKVGRDWRFKRQAVDALKRPIVRTFTPPPAARVPARRGGHLAGWHDFD